MPFCPKCGNNVEEGMAFCPRCGAPLKAEAPVQAAPTQARRRNEKAEKGEKQEKQEKREPEKGEKHEKGEMGFIGWLIGGLILIIIGLVAFSRVAGWLSEGAGSALVLLIIGAAVIIVGVYVSSRARKRYPQTA